MKICSVPNCTNHVASRGWCNKHYRRWYEHGDPLHLARTENGEPLRWLEWAFAQETDQCLLWPYAVLDDRGYGLSGNKDSTGSGLTHRWVCEQEHGPCPANHEAAHSCGTCGCCNKRHLSWKPHYLNEADKIQHGTSNRNTFSNEDILEIRRLSTTGLLQREIAEIFNTEQGVISKIINLKRRR